MDQETIDRNFKYHALKDDQRFRYDMIRKGGKEFVEFVSNVCPDSRELSLSIAKTEEAVMWAIAAIAHNE